MSDRNPFLDPVGGALGVAAGVGSFFLIPGAAVAIPAALGIGALVYGAKVAISALRGDDSPSGQVGAGAADVERPLPKRGSPAEVWAGRGAKALAGLSSQVAATDGAVLRGQLENVALETSGSQQVLDELALQVASVEQAMERIPLERIAADQRHLEQTLAREDTPYAARVEAQDAQTNAREQGQAYYRLNATRTELLARMERVVLGLEGLRSHVAEIIAVSATALPVDGLGGEQRIAEIDDELTALRAGLEESRAYTDRVLRGDAS